MGSSGHDLIAVFIESGRKQVFASALDWPGWARSGKTEELAVQALADYLPRYLAIVGLAGTAPPAGELAVVERYPGVAKNADFGALGEIAAAEHKPLSGEAGARLALLLEASWQAFDEGARAAPPVLRKGPRGGGRDTDQIVQHVLEAEAVYARKMGLARDKTAEAGQVALRQRIAGALRVPASLQMPPTGWPVRYAVRRIGWHVLDHLWEIEDKSEPA
ncbi:MAG: hypothetical protein ACLQFR_19480 [Streptosporangiaceae bacterium]